MSKTTVGGIAMGAGIFLVAVGEALGYTMDEQTTKAISTLAGLLVAGAGAIWTGWAAQDHDPRIRGGGRAPG